MKRCPSYKLWNCSELPKCHLPNPHNITENNNKQRKPQFPAQDSRLNEEHRHLPVTLVKTSMLSLTPLSFHPPHSVCHKSCCPFVQNISTPGQHLIQCIILILKSEPLPRTHEALPNSPLLLLNKHSYLCLRGLAHVLRWPGHSSLGSFPGFLSSACSSSTVSLERPYF